MGVTIAVGNDVEREVLALAEHTLARLWPGSRPGSLRALAGDASSRRYMRLEVRQAGQAPASLVVMWMPDAGVALSSEELGVFGAGGPRELPFANVQRYLSRLTDAVPAIHAVSRDFRVLLLEDVGDVSLWTAGCAEGAEPLFERALLLLADLQHRAVDDGSGCYAFGQMFDEKLFGWELEHFLTYGVEPGADRTLLKACSAELTALARRLAALPRVFCHRDYHPWNLHVHAGRIRILDFQDALTGPALYDVASLLTDRTTPDIVTPDVEERLVSAFHAAQEAGRLGSLAETHETYRLCALQRALKVIGRFHYLNDVKGKPGYLAMVPAEIATARRLASAAPGFDATREVLAGPVRGIGEPPCS